MPNTVKQRTPIVLPTQAWVPHWQLRRAIAEAFIPDRRRASGVAILTNKTLRSGLASGLPYKLSDEDRALLETLAGELPPIHLGASDSDWTAFLEAFTAKTPELNWVPLAPSAADLYTDYCSGMAIADEHISAMRRLLAANRDLRAINNSKAPVSEIAADTSIARADLEKYFSGQRIAVVVERPRPKPASITAGVDLELQPLVRPAQQAPAPPVEKQIATLELTPKEEAREPKNAVHGGETLLQGRKAAGRAKRFTPDQLDFLIQRHANGDAWKAIAAELGMAISTLEGHLTAHRKSKAEQQRSEPARDAFGRLVAAVTRPHS